MGMTEEQLKETAVCEMRTLGYTGGFDEGFQLIKRFLAALPKYDGVICGVCDGKGTITDTENCEWPCYQCAKSKVANAAGEQNTVVLPFAIFDQEIADLRRFHECAMDDESYDVPKDRMKRLAEIGLVRRVSANYYEHTDFGLSVLNGDFDTAPQPDYKAQRDALLEALKDMRAGWKYIRETHGDLYGVGWDRAQNKADSAIALAQGEG